MVYFYCNVCGESLKKNQVEKHYQQKCRNCSVLSCVDCGQEFHGSEYEKHIKCISEEEKYSGKNYKPKANANKGEQKQELWIEQVQEAISKVQANPKLKALLEQLKSYPNIPRKRAKFENFLANSLRVRDTKLAGQAWDAVSSELMKSADSQPNGSAKCSTLVVQTSLLTVNDSDSVNGNSEPPQVDGTDIDSVKSKKKKKKRKLSESADLPATVDDAEKIPSKKKRKRHQEKVAEQQPSEEPQIVCEEDVSKASKKKTKKKKRKTESLEDGMVCEEQPPDDDGNAEDEQCASFKWEAAIIGVLKRAPDNQLALKKLRKKVLSEFNARCGDGKVYTEEKLLAKFTRKVNKNSRLKIHKDVVKLLH